MDYGYIADMLELFAGIDENENTDYAQLLQTAEECRALEAQARTDAILRALWDASDAGRLTVRKYRVGDITGKPLTLPEDRAVLDTGLVVEVPGMGGPSSYKWTITADDMQAYSVGETWSAELDRLSSVIGG